MVYIEAMWRFLLRVVLLAGLILGLAHLLPGLDVPNFPDALLFALVVALLNATITPILIVVSFPITVMTIGLFAILINVFVFWLASLISYGVYITNFWGAFWGGIIVSTVSFFLNIWLSNLRFPKPK
jgi:putative membrane protein